MAELAAIFSKRTSQAWIELLARENVPAGPIYAMDEVFADPQVQHLEMASPLEHPELGPIRLVSTPLTLSRTPPSVRSPADGHGAHSAEVLAEVGISQDELESLRASGVI